MNRKTILSKISLILIVAFLSTSTLPATVYGQSAFDPSPFGSAFDDAEENNNFNPNSASNGLNQPGTSNPFGGTFNAQTGQFEAFNSGQAGQPFFDFPTTDPTLTDIQDVNANTGNAEENIESCMTELVQDSLLNTLSISAGDILGDLGLQDLIGDATGAISGAITGITGDIGGAIGGGLGDLGTSIGGSLGGAIGDLGGSLGGAVGNLGGSLGGSLGGVTGGLLGGGGGSTVPVNDDIVRSETAQNRQNTGGLVAKETGNGQVSFDGITGCLVNKTIEGILHGTIDWINRGFDGNPVFIDNPGKFFGNIADYEVGNFLNELSGGILCSHIDVQLRVELATNYNNQRYGGGYRSRCSLSQISDNVEAFVNGDFRQGGFNALFVLTQNPYNNYYGARAALEVERDSKIAAKQSLAAWEQRNTDFLSKKDPATGNIVTPGATAEAQVNQRLNTPIQRLSFADEFDEIMNGLVNQFINISIGDLF